MDALGWQARATVVVAMRAGLGREVARGDVILAACVAVLVALGVRNTGALASANRLPLPRVPRDGRPS